MKTTYQLILFILLATVTVQADAEAFKKVYLDQKNNVHLITREGKRQQVTTKGNAALLKLAPDNETVAWLVLNAWKADGDDIPGSEELAIYRKGKQISIKCTPFIRDYWFWAGGKQIAIDCGGRRFAGREILYDATTLKELASFDQANVPLDKRPDWSSDHD
ncbi:hypothetical protein [Massilia consociata]|uniref:Uncharacterized protein n=1 Tax=Massilia consociata TaxID=760117 RepID=A0ABV6FIX3_9BURK